MTLPPSAAPPPGPEGADPSMEEILASIRRILNEEDPNAAPGDQAVPAEDDVLVLDHSMLIAAPEPVLPQAGPGRAEAGPVDAMPAEPAPEPAHPTGEPAPAALPDPLEPAGEPPFQAPVVLAMAAPEPDAAPAPAAEPDPPPQAAQAPRFGHALVAAETAAAAASSVDGLLRTLAASRATQVYRGGPTIEDLVREEVRPMLKQWLDANLPPLVERLVQAEIERVVGRALP